MQFDKLINGLYMFASNVRIGAWFNNIQSTNSVFGVINAF